MPTIGYCLWCGAVVTIACYDARNGQIEWTKCNAYYPCKGALVTVITDSQGFVIFPRYKEGFYIHSRKIPDMKNGKTMGKEIQDE